MSEPIALCYSGGKDSVLALNALRVQGQYQVVDLITTVTDAYDRVSMHGTRRSLIRAQCEALGLPLGEVVVPAESSLSVYEERMGEAFAGLYNKGIRHVAFGDIFLHGLRTYREEQLAVYGLEGVFPIWGRSTKTLAHRFIDEGYGAVTVCVNAQVLDASFVGRTFDESFLADLPPSVDPCGENGEFHTFVHAGPVLPEQIPFTHGKTIQRGDFFFHDLRPL